MIDHQLRRRGIHDEAVLRAMLEVPREEFIPPEYRRFAYEDDPVPIGFSQTISQPFMVALMVQALELRGGEKVLEIGGGSGYHAAILGKIAGSVVSVEIVPELAEQARANLARTGLDGNVTVVTGDGSEGYAPLAPYDAVSVAAGAPEIPPALIDQLADPGRLVIPIGSRDDQALRIITKFHGDVVSRFAGACRFVPLRGEHGWER